MRLRQHKVRDLAAGVLADWYGLDGCAARMLYEIYRRGTASVSDLTSVGITQPNVSPCATRIRRALDPGSLPIVHRWCPNYELSIEAREEVRSVLADAINELAGGIGLKLASPARIAELEAKVEALERAADIAPIEERVLPTLTYYEDKVLRVLATGKPTRRQVIYEHVYGHLPEADQPLEKVVDVFVCKIRAKLPENMKIETIRGEGYRLIAA